jgi:hypothetical protein
MAASGEEVLMRRTLALLFLALPLAACGGDVTSLDPVAQAAEKTTNVAGAHFVISARIVAEGETVQFSGPGEIADHGREFHMRMAMPAALLGMKGLRGKTVTLEAIGAGESFYFRGLPFEEVAGNKWVKIPDTSKSINLGQNDPSQMLEYLRATSKVEERGTDTVRGVETTHYKARVQLDKVADRVSADAAKTLEQLTQQTGIKEVPFDVWVDDEGLVRRIVMDWHPKGGSFRMSIDLFDFGNVDIAVPDASETVNLDELLGGG